MSNVYPGGISCIVPKGDWLLKLGKRTALEYVIKLSCFYLGFIECEIIVSQGVGAAYDHVGTKDSIMIRVPDHTVTAHLCDITGPLAITSANPSGEPDSTHHDMIIK